MGEELKVLEEQWERRVQRAKLHLDLCRLYVKQMQALAAQIPPQDGGYGFQKALRSEKSALAEYTRTLRIYSDLVVYGKVPDAAGLS
jgi:hypothetical protein